MKRFLLAISMACIFSPGSVYAEDTPSVKKVNYLCKNDRRVKVSYIGGHGGAGEQVLLDVDGDENILGLSRSGSGARYSDGSLVWWNKGKEGFVMLDVKIIIDGCVAQ